MQPGRIKTKMRHYKNETQRDSTPNAQLQNSRYLRIFLKTCEIALQKRAAGHPKTTLKIFSTMHWCGGKS